MISDIEALKKWKELSKIIQRNILENVWCSSCGGSTSMTVESIRNDDYGIILTGKCKTCGKSVVRCVEN